MQDQSLQLIMQVLNAAFGVECSTDGVLLLFNVGLGQL